VVYGTRARNDQLLGSRGQRSRSHKAKHRFGEESFSTLLGPVAFLILLITIKSLETVSFEFTERS